MKRTIHRPSSPADQANWLKGLAMLRAYTAQRDHFLAAHARPAGRATRRGQAEADSPRDTARERE